MVQKRTPVQLINVSKLITRCLRRGLVCVCVQVLATPDDFYNQVNEPCSHITTTTTTITVFIYIYTQNEIRFLGAYLKFFFFFFREELKTLYTLTFFCIVHCALTAVI